MTKSAHNSKRRALSAREIERMNEHGYQVNAIVDNQLLDDQRSDAVKPIRARRRNTTALTARARLER